MKSVCCCSQCWNKETLVQGKPQHEAVHGSLQAYSIMSNVGTDQSSAWLIFFFFLIMCVSVFFCVQLQLKHIHLIYAGYDAASFFWL